MRRASSGSVIPEGRVPGPGAGDSIGRQLGSARSETTATAAGGVTTIAGSDSGDTAGGSNCITVAGPERGGSGHSAAEMLTGSGTGSW